MTHEKAVRHHIRQEVFPAQPGLMMFVGWWNTELDGPQIDDVQVLLFGVRLDATSDNDDDSLTTTMRERRIRGSSRLDDMYAAGFEYVPIWAYVMGDLEEPWNEVGKEIFFTREGAVIRVTAEHEAEMAREEARKATG